jgi:FKBP-type peptidyl-prolyl cis-trans isomerase (trigger factor)
MGEPAEVWAERIGDLSPYAVTTEIMDNAGDGAVFMHCLPSYHDLKTTIGKEVGETFDVPVKFPENYHAELAGKDAVFTMTLNHIYEGTVLTDEIAVEQKQESVEAWVDLIYNEQMINTIWDLVPGLKDVTVPADAYTFFHQFYLDSVHATAFNYFENDFNKALTYYGFTEETLLDYSKNAARIYLLGAQIADHYDLSPSEELTEEVLKDYMKLYNITEEKAKENIANEGKFEFRARLLSKLSAMYLIENNTFVKTSK